MEISKNNTPIIIKWLAVAIFGFVVYLLSDANYNIMLRITQEKFIGEQNPFYYNDSVLLADTSLTDYIYSSDSTLKIKSNKGIRYKLSETKRLYNTFLGNEKRKALAKALGYSLATLLIIIYFKNYLIKILFVCLDSTIVFVYLNKSYDVWWLYGSYIYSIYTGITLFFVGLVFTDLIKELTQQPEKPKESELKPLKDQIELLMLEQKRFSEEFAFVTDRDNQIKEVNRKIAARKQKLYRDKQDWKSDDEVLKLIEEKENL